MEDKHDVEGHALLGHEHFLISVNDKVATLVVSALSRSFDDLIFAQSRQVAELRADHDWDLANGHFILLEYLLLRFDHSLPSCRVFVAIVDLQNLHLAENFSLVSQLPDTRRVWQDWLVGTVTLVESRELVDCGTAKYDFVSGLFVIASIVLSVLRNCLFFELLDNLLHRVLEESFERRNLLRHQTILLEVAVNNFPAVVLVDSTHVDFDFGSTVTLCDRFLRNQSRCMCTTCCSIHHL